MEWKKIKRSSKNSLCGKFYRVSVVNSSETGNIQIIVQQQASYQDYKEHSLENSGKACIN